jgi:hypothetical protein
MYSPAHTPPSNSSTSSPSAGYTTASCPATEAAAPSATRGSSSTSTSHKSAGAHTADSHLYVFHSKTPPAMNMTNVYQGPRTPPKAPRIPPRIRAVIPARTQGRCRGGQPGSEGYGRAFCSAIVARVEIEMCIYCGIDGMIRASSDSRVTTSKNCPVIQDVCTLSNQESKKSKSHSW